MPKIDVEKIGIEFGKKQTDFPIGKKDFMDFAEDFCNDMLMDASKDMSDVKDALIQKAMADSGQSEGDDFEEAYSDAEGVFNNGCAKGLMEKIIEKGIKFKD